MKLIDLSHIISEDISVFPGTEKPIFERKEIEGYPEVKMTMYTHTATHIDAPIHIIKGARTLDEMPIQHFIGKAIVIDCTPYAGLQIPLSFLKKYEAGIKNVDFLLIKTGWSAKWKTAEYFEGFATLSMEATQWLTQFQLKGIGLDCISLDPVSDLSLPNHKMVLAKEILIIENLTDLDVLPLDKEFIFQCLPLKIEKADGSPVRAIAILN